MSADSLPASASAWGVADVGRWLAERLDLKDSVVDAFADAGVDGPTLLALSEEDLSGELGIDQRLVAKKIMGHVAVLRHHEIDGVGGVYSDYSPERRSAAADGCGRQARTGGGTAHPHPYNGVVGGLRSQREQMLLSTPPTSGPLRYGEVTGGNAARGGTPPGGPGASPEQADAQRFRPFGAAGAGQPRSAQARPHDDGHAGRRTLAAGRANMLESAPNRRRTADLDDVDLHYRQRLGARFTVSAARPAPKPHRPIVHAYHWRRSSFMGDVHAADTRGSAAASSRHIYTARSAASGVDTELFRAPHEQPTFGSARGGVMARASRNTAGMLAVKGKDGPGPAKYRVEQTGAAKMDRVEGGVLMGTSSRWSREKPEGPGPQSYSPRLHFVSNR